MKVLVAHPAQQHSYRLATSLKRKNILLAYSTTVYYKKRNLTSFVSMILKGNFKQKAQLRRMEEVPDDEVIQFCEGEGLLKLLALHVKLLEPFYFFIKESTAHRFSKKVAKWAKRNRADAVIFYDDSDGIGIKWLKEYAPNIVRIMDVSAAHRAMMKEIYERDMVISPDFASKLKQEVGYVFDQKHQNMWNAEVANSQYFLVASQFVKHSLMNVGVNSNQIYVCPYGVDTTSFNRKQLIERSDNELIRFVYIGGTKQLKGLSYLLGAYQRLDHSKATLTIIGTNTMDKELVRNYAKDVTFTGTIMHDDVPNYLNEADVMVFPSLGDGFGLSVVEALACGLPTICSENSGVSDIINEGENGFVIPVQDESAIYEKMKWFIENRDKIVPMGKSAMETAQELTWDKYYKRTAEVIESIIEKERSVNF